MPYRNRLPMRHVLRPVLWAFAAFLFFNFLVASWVMAHDLKRRFPNLQFKSARVGVASWYSRSDRGIKKITANGENFDDKKLTCATWDYPFDEKLVVINMLNGKWTACRVNDRGPHKRLGRAIDLTRAAFSKIGKPEKGLIYVTIIPSGDPAK